MAVPISTVITWFILASECVYSIKSVQTEWKQRISRADCFLPCYPGLRCYPPFLWLLTMCSQDKSCDDRTYGCCHNLFNLFNLHFSLFALITLNRTQVIWGREYLHDKCYRMYSVTAFSFCFETFSVFPSFF